MGFAQSFQYFQSELARISNQIQILFLLNESKVNFNQAISCQIVKIGVRNHKLNDFLLRISFLGCLLDFSLLLFLILNHPLKSLLSQVKYLKRLLKLMFITNQFSKFQILFLKFYWLILF